MARRNLKSPPPFFVVQWTQWIVQSRHFMWSIVLLLVLSGGLFFWSMAQHAWGARTFPVRHVAVTGTHYLDRNHLQQVLAPLMRGGFFSLHPARVREIIRDMPWVADAMVQRTWPDRVVITIQERVPVAHWNNSSLLSTTGDVFTPDMRSVPDALPSFSGPAGAQMRVLSCFRSLQHTLSPLKTDIAALTLTPLLSWEVVLKNGIQMHLGRQDILTHLGHFVKVYPSVVGNRIANVEYVDLRYPDGFAVRWKKQQA